MKVKYIGKKQMDFIVSNNEIDLEPGKIYDVIEISPKMGFYRIVDGSGEDYLYPPEFFEVVEE